MLTYRLDNPGNLCLASKPAIPITTADVTIAVADSVSKLGAPTTLSAALQPSTIAIASITRAMEMLKT